MALLMKPKLVQFVERRSGVRANRARTWGSHWQEEET
jgi:hypothetical protein